MKEWRAFGGGVAATIVIIFVLMVYARIRVNHLQRGFDAVHNGELPAEVRAQIGSPWRLEQNCAALHLGGQPSSCRFDYAYHHPLAPAFPTYWIIYFGADGRVIDKAVVSSRAAD